MYEKVEFHHCTQILCTRLKSMEKASMVHIIKESIRSKAADANPNKYYYFDGHWWMQDSYQAWQSAFPWLSKRTIGQYLRDLCIVCTHDGDKCEGECKKPCLLRKMVGSKTSGKTPNFYRLNPDWAVAAPKEKSADPIGKNCVNPREKSAYAREEIASSSYSNNQAINPSTNLSHDEREDCTEIDICTDLNALAPQSFKPSLIIDLMTKYEIPAQRMRAITDSFVVYYSGEPLKRPRQCFEAWVTTDLDKTRIKGWREKIKSRKLTLVPEEISPQEAEHGPIGVDMVCPF